jgi:hypothetical protein
MKIKLNWGNSLIIFFLVFFVWVFSFVFFAMRQNNDLVTDDYYQQGAKYTDQININQRSLAYQDSLQINATASRIQLTLCKSLAVERDSVQVYFFRSSDKAKDRRFGFKKTDSPLMIDKNMLFHGRYLVFVSWNDRGEKFMVKKVLDVE